MSNEPEIADVTVTPPTVWEQLTPIQADAVHATAVAHLLDPTALAEELLPLLIDTTTPQEKQ